MRARFVSHTYILRFHREKLRMTARLRDHDPAGAYA